MTLNEIQMNQLEIEITLAIKAIESGVRYVDKIIGGHTRLVAYKLQVTGALRFELIPIPMVVHNDNNS